MADQRFDEALRDLEAGPSSTVGGGHAAGASADASSHPTVAALYERFAGMPLHHVVMAGDEHVVYVPADRNVELLRWLKEDPAQHYDYLADVTAVDFGHGRPLEVVYQLWSIPHRRALRIKATLPLDALEIDSVVPLWNAANWLEREVFDLFGIHFRGHPDLRRILMPEKYAEGHPLRKDFPLRGRFSRAEQTRRALSMEVEDYYIPEELRIAEALQAQPGGAGEPDETPPQGLQETAREVTESAVHARRPDKAAEWALGAPESAGGGVAGPDGVV